MDVDVDFPGRNIKEQRQHCMAVARQHLGIGAAHRPHQQAVLHRPAVDEQVLVIGHPAIEGRQPGHPGQPGRAALQIDQHAILGQFTRDNACHALRQTFARLRGQGPASVMLQRKAQFGPGHGQTADDVEAGSIFGPRTAQELAPRRHLFKQPFHPHPGARRQRGGAFFGQRAIIDHAPPALCPAHPAFQRQGCDTGDRGERLAPEAQSGDLFDGVVGQLRGGMPLQRQRQFGRAHPAAIVGHFDSRRAAFPQPHRNGLRAGVDGVLDQLLQCRSRTLDHLAGGDAVDQRFGQAADGRHRPPL